MSDEESPPPEPPQALAPGPRATALLRVYDDAVDRVARACSYDQFAACFPTPAQHAPDSLQGLHRKFTKRLADVCRSEFQELLEQRGVVQSLNELDGLVRDARGRKAAYDADPSAQELPSPPHLLPPPSLLAAHFDPLLSVHRDALTKDLEETSQKNVDLAQEIQQQRQAIEQLLKGIEVTVKDIENAADRLYASHEVQNVQAELEKEATSIT